MRRIEIESFRCDQQVGRIGRFKNEHAACAKDAQGFVQKLDHRFERQMLDDMKARDGGAALRSKSRECFQAVGQLHVEAAFPALFDRNAVQIESAPRDARFLEKFKPFPAAAADIDDRRLICGRGGSIEPRKIDALALLDLRARAPITILERNVQRIKQPRLFARDRLRNAISPERN